MVKLPKVMVLECAGAFSMWVLVGGSSVMNVNEGLYLLHCFHMLEEYQPTPPCSSLIPTLYLLIFLPQKLSFEITLPDSNRCFYDRRNSISERKCHSRGPLSTCQAKIQESSRGSCYFHIPIVKCYDKTIDTRTSRRSFRLGQ